MKKTINKNEIIDKFRELLELYNKMENKVNIRNDNNSNNISINKSLSQKISKKSYNEPLNIGDSSYSINSQKDIRNKNLLSQIIDAQNNSFTSIIKTNEIIIEYNNKKDKESIILLGEKFINNNKNNIKIIFNEKEQEIKSSYRKDEFKTENNILEVRIKIISELRDMSNMFRDCSSLISIKDFRIDTRNVTDMSYLFRGCCSLENLPDISIWDTSNVTNMEYMFYGCESLKQLPDISKWKTYIFPL